VAVEPRRVSWGGVIGGLLIAWFSGIFVGVGAVMGSLLLRQERPTQIVIVVAAVALFYFALFWLTRRRAFDLAIGILLGGCMVTAISGLCGAMLT
jgi:high-affinity Fe2+/Pb2+ permease